MTAILMIVTAMMMMSIMYFAAVYTFVVESWRLSKASKPNLWYLVLNWWSIVIQRLAEIILLILNMYTTYWGVRFFGVSLPNVEYWFNAALPFVAGGATILLVVCVWVYHRLFSMKEWVQNLKDDIMTVYVNEPGDVIRSYVITFVVNFYFAKSRLTGEPVNTDTIKLVVFKNKNILMFISVLLHGLGFGGYFWPGAMVYNYIAFYRDVMGDD